MATCTHAAQSEVTHQHKRHLHTILTSLHSWSCAQEDDSNIAAAPEEEDALPGKAAPGHGPTKDKCKGKKRSGEDIIEREKERSKKAKEAATRKAEWFELKQNTSVYVSGLPSDVTEEEVAQVWPQLHGCTCGYLM